MPNEVKDSDSIVMTWWTVEGTSAKGAITVSQKLNSIQSARSWASHGFEAWEVARGVKIFKHVEIVTEETP